MSLKGKKVGLQGFSFYNSMFNISSTLGNNTITFKFPNYSAANVYTMKSFVWTISDGFYTWVQFNDALTQWLTQQKLYTYNSTTKLSTFFVQLLENKSAYAIQWNVSLLPNQSYTTSIPVAGCPITLNPATTNAIFTAPQITWTESPNLSKMFGFAKDTTITLPSAVYTADSTIAYATRLTDGSVTKSVLSTKAPQINLVDSVVLCCNIANNKYSLPNSILSCTPISSTFGALTQYNAQSVMYVPCNQTVASRIEIQMYDQDLNPLFQRDAELTLVLSIMDDI
jgi:hypothetical protein